MSDNNIVGTAHPETVTFFSENLAPVWALGKKRDAKQAELFAHKKANERFLILAKYIKLQDEYYEILTEYAQEYVAKDVGKRLSEFSKMIGEQFGPAPEGKMYHLEPATGIVTLIDTPGGNNAAAGA